MKEEEQFINKLLMWQAHELARKGRYREAETILEIFDSSEAPQKAGAYDLLGRIMVKKKRYSEAKAFFQKAIAFDPGNAASRQALEYLPVYLRKKRFLKTISLPSILLITCIGTWTGIRISRGNQTVDAPSPQPSLLSGKSEITGNAAIPAERTANQSVRKWPSFDISGVTTKLSQSEMSIQFDEGIFTDKCELSDKSPQLLAAVGEQITQSHENFLIVIEGHTDNLPVVSGSEYGNNYLLGLRRAEKIAGIFRKCYGFKEYSLITVSVGEDKPLFSNNRKETRANNRTVRMRIIPTK